MYRRDEKRVSLMLTPGVRSSRQVIDPNEECETTAMLVVVPSRI
jgi:hypothetical protein